jgi:hypothetical protein
MPRRRRDGLVDLGQIISSSADIVSFMVDGLFSFMEDKSYHHKYTRTTPPAFRDKSGVICAYRLLNKELREEVDRRILVWMGKVSPLMITIRETTLKADAAAAEDRRLNLSTSSAARSTAMARKQDARNALQNHLGTCFSDNLSLAMSYDLSTTDRLTQLDFSISTFMCMATERCQIHGPLGGCQCRNVVGAWSAADENFTQLEFGTKKFTVFSREKCVDAVCVKPNARFLSHGNDQQLSVNTARAMFRLKGVHHPFTQEGICKATNCWGEVSPSTAAIVTFVENMMTSTSLWPKKIMLFRHPSIDDKRCSIQGVLGLTDAEAKACHNDAVRKQQQRLEREAEIKNKHIEELYADVDSYMASSKEFPVSSLKELGGVCSGMEDSIRHAVVHNASMSGASCKHHGMDIEIVRNGLGTAKTYLGEIIAFDRKISKDLPICSSEAYDYLSGMHVGRYGTVTPDWAPAYGNLDGYKIYNNRIYSHDRTYPMSMRKIVSTAVCKAMRFFDALDGNSLLAFESRPHDPLPKRWLLSNNQMSFVFEAHFPGPTSTDSTVLYKNLTKMDADIRRLISLQESDIKLPVLFTKLTHTNGVMTTCSKKASEAVKKWYMDCYRLLVEDPSTRCAALDLLGVRPHHLIDRAMDKDGACSSSSGGCSSRSDSRAQPRATVPGSRVEWSPDNPDEESDYDWEQHERAHADSQ